MKNKKLYVTIISLITVLSLQGCVQKLADGTYPKSVYSYHPYNDKNSKKNIQIKVKKDSYNPRKYNSFINRKTSLNNPMGQKIEQTAKSHLGKNYKWGATGPYAFDCSGFTSSVFKNNGIKLPRKSKDQARVGKIVRLRKLKKGDLIFFDSKKSSKVSHVGIYLEQGKFIHASSSKKGVIISNLNSNYYSKHFKWGRRFL